MDESLQPAEVSLACSGFIGATAHGRLIIAPGSLTFEPGWVARHLMRFSERLVHRNSTVVIVSARLTPWYLTVVLRADGADDSIVLSPLVGRRRVIQRGIVWLRPGRHRRARAAISGAGFAIDQRRRWLYFGLQAID